MDQESYSSLASQVPWLYISRCYYNLIFPLQRAETWATASRLFSCFMSVSQKCLKEHKYYLSYALYLLILPLSVVPGRMLCLEVYSLLLVFTFFFFLFTFLVVPGLLLGEHMRAATKVMPPILLSWPLISEADVGIMAVQVELPHQYSITCCCHVTGGSRRAVCQNGIWHESAYEASVELSSSVQKKIAPVAFIDTCWMFMETKQWMSSQWGGGW